MVDKLKSIGIVFVVILVVASIVVSTVIYTSQARIDKQLKVQQLEYYKNQTDYFKSLAEGRKDCFNFISLKDFNKSVTPNPYQITPEYTFSGYYKCLAEKGLN